MLLGVYKTWRVRAVPTEGERGEDHGIKARMQRWGPRAVTAADGGLLAAAAVGMFLGLIALGAGLPLFVGVAALLLAPLLAWWLHGRRVDGTATLGASLGFLVGVAVAYGVLALGVAIRSVFGLSEGNAPVVIRVGVAVIVAAYLVVMVWLDIDALRDLSPQRRTHVRVDILRLFATVTYVALIVGVIVWARGASPDKDRVPALFVLNAPGAPGAAAVMGAESMVSRHEQHGHAHLVSGA